MMALGANQQAVMSSGGVTQSVEVNAEREIKWIRNWYEYDGERVGDIIAQLNRRHDVKVVVDDPQVLRLRLTSLSFKPSEPKQFVSKVNRWYADYPRKTSARGVAVHLQRP
jgi:ferric-dicitrate binding protein FerR (iron transport regulator)